MEMKIGQRKTVNWNLWITLGIWAVALAEYLELVL
jgi:hypothetical protein